MLSSATSSAGALSLVAVGQQVVGVRIGVRRHLQRDALMQPVGGYPVQIVARHLEDRDAGIGCDP